MRLTFALTTVLLLLGGCTWFRGSAGTMRVQSLGQDPAVLAGEFRTALFSYDQNASASFMLTDAPLDDLFSGKVENGRVLHVQLLWVPLAGNTPMDATATNASIRFVVIANGEVGVYSGAGFAMPADDLTDRRVTMHLRDASLQLQEATAGFNDLLSPAYLTGSFKATRNDQKAKQMNRAASQLVTNALGKTRFVKAECEDSEAPG